MKILLVENEPDIIRLISYVLAAEGFSVACAPDAATAESLLLREPFDCVLLDLMLPGEDGYSFCRRLKNQVSTSQVPVIIISARVMPEEIRRGLDCGADGYITKPYNPVTLGSDIRRIAGRAEAGGATPPA